MLLHSDDPTITYWAVASVHFMSSAFFAATRPVAERFAEANPAEPALIYFEGTHHLLYKEAASDRGEPRLSAALAQAPLTEEQRKAVLRMMRTIADYGVRQFDRLARAMTTDRHQFEFLEG